MITDPAFYALAIPAVILTGLAKGGFLGALGGFAVPLMSLVISPIEAAGIMLPILIAMDMVGLAAYRGEFHRANLEILLPAAVAGIALGWMTAAYVSEAHVRLIVGLVGFVYAARYWISHKLHGHPGPSRVKGTFWGLVAGFTSFVSHTGAPPFQVYMLPQRLPNTIYAGTAVVFFAVVNLIKVVPYFALGQFSVANLSTVAVLIPLAPLAMLAGVWLTRRVPQQPFYLILHAALLIVSLKLIYDALAILL
ncbi:MAG: sulfite exporter TauE/SafE family protein [Alphaproteobacteria bacterium]|nr:sulfite exporter TauE/SafE family protein [Alphaproteobacteria bacterium]